ncbi:type II secretion system protein GspD [Thermodesulfobacteriota bacterium]
MDPLLPSTKKGSILFILIIFFILLVGCALPEPQPVKNKEMDGMDPGAILRKAKRISPPGPPPFSEKLAPVTKGLEQETKLFTLVFNNAPLGEVVRAITQDTDLNLSVESEVDLSRPVTVQLKKVTFKEALDMVVVKGAGYVWKIQDGNLNIKRFEERIYQLDSLDLSAETEIAVGGDMLASGVAGSGVTGKFQVKISRPVEITDVWTAIQNDLEGLKSNQGTLRINRSAGIIYMADTPSRIAAMVRFLDSLSESLHRQVFLEAKIMEVKLNDTYKYGIDWSSMNIGFTSDSSALPDNLNISFNSGGSVALANQSSLSFILDFLRTQGDVSVLSNPHLSVMNGRSAVMTVGFQFPYGDVTGVDRDPETGVITFGTSIKRTVLGLQLGITPQISRDGTVTLHIVPTVTRIQGEEKVELPTSVDTTQTISNPIIDLQELATTVRVREGDSIVLAESNDSGFRIPIHPGNIAVWKLKPDGHHGRTAVHNR